MLNRSDIMDFCLASDERDYKEEVIFSPYIIGNTDGNVLPVKIDLNIAHIHETLYGKRVQHKGYKLIPRTDYEIEKYENESC